jgi:hypothetical protein
VTIAPPPSSRAAAIWFWICTLAAAVTATVVAYGTLDAGFLHGTGERWQHPDNDLVAYIVGWSYFINDRWRFPIFDVPAMSYPEGGNVLFVDALPLTAILTKAMRSLTGVSINPFGPWTLLTYVLQGVFATRLLFAVGVRSLPASIAAAVLTTTASGFVWRMSHTAVSSHFLILWALAVYFESWRGRDRLIELWVLAAVTLLINSYLFVMVMALHAVTVVTLAVAGRWDWRSTRIAFAGAAGVVAIALAAGYGIVFTNPASMQAMGFGHFSWNVASLFVSRTSGVVRDATGGQYEGDAYIGIGALALLAAAIVTRPGTIARHLRDHRYFVALLVLLAVYAASNRVFAGSTLLFSYSLPPRIEALGGFFRATGRFIWPVAYSLIVLSLACVFRAWPRPLAVAAAIIAVTLQVREASPIMHYLQTTTARSPAPAIDGIEVEAWVRGHARVWQYPSWGCGGLIGPSRVWGGLDANRELQIQLVAARTGTPTNSVYTSRILKDCDREKSWGGAPRFEDGVLYIVSWKAAVETPALAAAIAAGPCAGQSWAIVCSNTFRPPARRQGPDR